MKRTRKTVGYKGVKIRLLGWGNTYSYWLFSSGDRVAINSGFRSQSAALRVARQHVNLIAA